MKPGSHRKLSRVLAIGTIAVLACTAAATQKQIHPPVGTGAPVVIAVIADHYLAGEESEFDYDAANFFTTGLLVDDYFQTRAGDLRIVTFFEPVAAGVKSNYEFDIDAGTSNCALGWTGNTLGKLEAVVNGINPTHIVVIGNHPYTTGCTEGIWTYVAADAVGSDVLQHEFGHLLAGLFDEWALGSNGATPYPKVIAANDRRNCSTATPPHWNGLLGSGAIDGCDLHKVGVIHAFTDCRMGATHHTTFCAVCLANMEGAFEYFKQPDVKNPDVENPNLSAAPAAPTGLGIIKTSFVMQPAPVPPTPPRPAPVDRPVLRLQVSFDPSNNALRAKGSSDATGRYVPSYRRLGEYVYEVLDGDRTLEVGVLPSQLFEARGYSGGAQHTTSPPKATDIVLQIPDESARSVAAPGRAVRVVIYKLMPSVTAPIINRSVFATIKASKQAERLAELTAEEIRRML